MAKIIIEVASEKDIPGLVKLETECFETDRLSAAQFKNLIKKSSTLVLVAKQNDVLVGDAIMLFRRNSKVARLYSIAVAAEMRRCGIAQLLSDALEQHVRKNYIEIRLEVRKDNRSAIQFYRKNGYEIFGEYEKFYEDGTDALRMCKLL